MSTDHNEPADALALHAQLEGQPSYQPPTEEEWERLEATNGLYALIQKYGAARVLSWVRNLAAIHGEPVDPVLYNDPYPAATRAVRDALEIECGPALASFLATFGYDHVTGIAGKLAKAALKAAQTERGAR